MVELTTLEKELWKIIQTLPINHKDYIKRGDMKRIQTKRKLLKRLKMKDHGNVSFYYHIEFTLFPISTQGWYPHGPDDFETSVDMQLEQDAMEQVKKVTFTGKWN